MQSIVVTGGLGFIGSNLIELLLKKKFKVINIDKVSYSSNFYNIASFSDDKNYKFYKCDLNNSKKLRPFTLSSIELTSAMIISDIFFTSISISGLYIV